MGNKGVDCFDMLLHVRSAVQIPNSIFLLSHCKLPPLGFAGRLLRETVSLPSTSSDLPVLSTAINPVCEILIS